MSWIGGVDRTVTWNIFYLKKKKTRNLNFLFFKNRERKKNIKNKKSHSIPFWITVHSIFPLKKNKIK